MAATGGLPKREPLIDRRKNPLAAIGLVLQDFSRGAKGQKLYSQELREQQAEDMMLQLKRTEIGAQALTKGMELIKNTPEAQREAVVAQFGRLYEPVMPGFTEIMTQAAQAPEATQAQIDALGEHAPVALATYGSAQAALAGKAKGDKIWQQWDTQADERNMPYIMSAFKRVDQVMKSDPRAQAALGEAAKEGWTMADLADPAVADAIGLSPPMIQTLRRSPELQATLQPLGFVPDAILTKKAEAEAGRAPEKPLSRIAAEASASANATNAAKPMNFVGPDGTIRAGTFGEREAMAAQGFQPLVTGRTPDDMTATDKAAAKVLGKQEGEDQLPISPAIARFAGVDPKTTRGEAVAMGMTPDVDATTLREMQSADAGTSNLVDLVGQARAVMAQNPDANTLTARLAGFATNMRANVEAFGRATGMKIDIEGQLEEHKDVWKDLGIDNQLMQQFAVSLAYMNAKTLDATGRLSDSDVRASARGLGAGAADRDILTASLDQAEATADGAFRNKVQSVTGVKPPSRLADIGQAEALTSQIESGTLKKADMQAAVAALTPRARRHLQTVINSRKAK